MVDIYARPVCDVKRGPRCLAQSIDIRSACAHLLPGRSVTYNTRCKAHTRAGHILGESVSGCVHSIVVHQDVDLDDAVITWGPACQSGERTISLLCHQTIRRVPCTRV